MTDKYDELKEITTLFVEAVLFDCDTTEDREDVVQYGNQLLDMLELDKYPRFQRIKRDTPDQLEFEFMKEDEYV